MTHLPRPPIPLFPRIASPSLSLLKHTYHTSLYFKQCDHSLCAASEARTYIRLLLLSMNLERLHQHERTMLADEPRERKQSAYS